MKNMSQAELKEYVKRLQDNDAYIATAEKTGAVLARKAVPGEEVMVYTKNGNLESPEPEIASEGSYVVTRANENKEPVIDDFGHTNSWIISEETFNKKYDVANMDAETGYVKPVGGKQTFIQIDEDIEFMAPWGDTQSIKEDGFLNITDLSHLYGIAYEEFTETYKVLDATGIDNKELDGKEGDDDFGLG